MGADMAGGRGTREPPVQRPDSQGGAPSTACQGNVIAAAALSSSAWEKRADYYVFYGCCGAVDSTLVGHVFRAASVSYMSLGVVEKPAEPRTQAGWWWRAVSRRLGSPGAEVVKLKNKWIVPTTPSEQAPLDPIQLTAGSAGAAGSLSGLGLPDAHVVATDKVIKVSPGVAPVPIFTPPPTYTKEDWTYSQALALYTGVPTTRPVVIEMETFGIASTMQAMGLGDRVIVLRVVTDALSNKAAQTPQQQLNFLRAGSAELAAAIATILGI